MASITGIELTSAKGCSFWNELTQATSKGNQEIMNGLYKNSECQKKISDEGSKKDSFKVKMKEFGFNDDFIDLYLPQLEHRTDKEIFKTISITNDFKNLPKEQRQKLESYIGLGNSETDEKIRLFGVALKQELNTLLRKIEPLYNIENFDYLYEKVKSNLSKMSKNNQIDVENDILKMLEFYVFSLKNPYTKWNRGNESKLFIQPGKNTDVDVFQDTLKSAGYTGELTIDTELDTILRKDAFVNKVDQELKAASNKKQELETEIGQITDKKMKELRSETTNTEKIKAESAAKLNDLYKKISAGENFVTDLKKKLNIVRIEVYTRLLEESITDLDLAEFFKKIQDEMSKISPETMSGGRKRNTRRSHGFRQRHVLHKTRKTKRRQNKRRRTQKR